MNIEEIDKLFKEIEPFNKLSELDRRTFAQSMDIEYYNKGEILSSSEKEPHYLYIIIKGIVRETDPEQETIKLYNEHDYFDPISLIENRSKNTFTVEQETICYTLPRETFLEITYKNEEIENYFFRSIAEKLGEKSNDNQTKELANFMVARVSEAYLQKPLIVASDETIYDVVKKMKEGKYGSVLVKDGDDYGIITDSDFKFKVILNRLSYESPVKEITTFGLITVQDDDFLFNAQLMMTKKSIKRVIVKNKTKNIVGILDQISLISFFASHTYAVSNEIENAQTIEDLKEAGKKTIRVIKTLYAKGVKVRYISKLISEFNEKIFSKIFAMTAPSVLQENCALIIMGSEGRGEQIMKTDQDNALIIKDNADIAPEILEDFTNSFSLILKELGYPECAGNIMVTNPYWRKPLLEYKKEIRNWIDKPSEEGMLNFAIFYDAKCVAGEESLLDEIKETIYKETNNNLTFFSHFAYPSLMFETPLSIFSNFKVEKDHQNELDIKKGGIFAIVQGIRTIALENRIKETNTVERIKAINNLEIIDREFASELIEAFNYLGTLRLKSSLEKIEKNQLSDNYINPSSLNQIDKDLLKDSFIIVNKFKKFLTYRYKLNMVG